MIVGFLLGVAVSTGLFVCAGLTVWCLDRMAERAENATRTRFTKRWELDG